MANRLKMKGLTDKEFIFSERFLIRRYMSIGFAALGIGLYFSLNGAPLAILWLVALVFGCLVILYFFDGRHSAPAFKVLCDRFVIQDVISLPSEKVILFSSIHEIRFEDKARIRFVTDEGEVSFRLAAIDKLDRSALKEHLLAWALEQHLLIRGN